jgi:hypothetical protein
LRQGIVELRGEVERKCLPDDTSCARASSDSGGKPNGNACQIKTKRDFWGENVLPRLRIGNGPQPLPFVGKRAQNSIPLRCEAMVTGRRYSFKGGNKKATVIDRRFSRE